MEKLIHDTESVIVNSSQGIKLAHGDIIKVSYPHYIMWDVRAHVSASVRYGI